MFASEKKITWQQSVLIPTSVFSYLLAVWKHRIHEDQRRHDGVMDEELHDAWLLIAADVYTKSYSHETEMEYLGMIVEQLSREWSSYIAPSSNINKPTNQPTNQMCNVHNMSTGTWIGLKYDVDDHIDSNCYYSCTFRGYILVYVGQKM